MLVSISKSTAFLLLGSAYTRFDPVPEGWEDIIPACERWERGSPPEGDEFRDSRIDLIRQVAFVIAKDAGDMIKSEVSSEVQVREGSLVIEVLILVPLIELIHLDILNAIEMAANDQDLKPWDAAVIVGRLIAEMTFLQKQVRKIALSLNTLITAVIGRKNVVRPEARIGVIANIIKFHNSLDAAKLKSATVRVRANAMTNAVKQLEKIRDVLKKDTDRVIVLNYLRIRTRDLKHLHSSDTKDVPYLGRYNAGSDKILEITKELSDTLSY